MYFFIYETKGLTLEQIDELYDEVSVARNSVGWVPTKSFVEKTGKVGPHEIEGGVLGKGNAAGGEPVSGDAGVVGEKSV